MTLPPDHGPATPADDATGRFSGEFLAPRLEYRFRLDKLRTNRDFYWWVARSIAVIFPCFSLVDLASLGAGAAWALLLGLRLAASAAILAVGHRLRRSPESFVAVRGRVALALVQALVLGAALTACALRPEDALTNALSTVVLMLATVVLVPGRFRDQVAVGAALCVGFVLVSAWRFDDPALPTVPLIANLAAALLWGATTLSFSNREHRRRWATSLREHEANARLVAEIAVADELRTELQLLARQDPLTTAANRREFLRVATELLEDPAVAPVSLLLMDADRFKSVNDRFGHAAGDAALVALVQATRRAVRDKDLVARVGGEEFAVLLPGLGGIPALETAERVRAAIAANRRDADLPVAVTVSIGVAEAAPEEPVVALMGRADAAMYRAKRTGGDAVTLAAPAGTAPPATPAAPAPGRAARFPSEPAV